MEIPRTNLTKTNKCNLTKTNGAKKPRILDDFQ